MKKIIYLTSCLLICCNLYSQEFKIIPDWGEPGKCYKKYLVTKKESELIPTKIKLCQYIGDEDIESFDKTVVYEASLQILPPRKDWEKVKGRCPNQKVWLWKDVAAMEKTFVIVADTNKVKDFNIIEVETYEVEEAETAIEWGETFCHNKVNELFLNKLKQKLIEKGYTISISADRCELMQVINQYQKDNNLWKDYSTYGQEFSISMQTLDTLGLK